MAEDAINNANFHRQMETMAARIATASRPLDFPRELLRSFEPPRSPVQEAIAAAEASISRNTITDFFDQAQAASRAARPYLDPISETIRRVMADDYLWQSRHTADFFDRFTRDSGLRSAILEGFDDEEQETPPSGSEIPVQTVLEAVESGLNEAVSHQDSRSAQESVQSMFALLRQLPKGTRGFVMSVLASLVASFIFVYFQPAPITNNYFSLTIAPQQQIRIVQREARKIITEQGLDVGVQRQLRVVKQDSLSVHRTHRRDSPSLETLPRAKVVIILSQRRNWTKISWSESEGGKLHVGWVQTRYLKKIGSR